MSQKSLNRAQDSTFTRGMRPRRALLAILAAVGSAVAVTPAARAQQNFFTWSGPANGTWSSAGNWTPFGVPDVASDVAVIPGGGSPVLNISVTLDKLGIGPGATVQHANNVSMTILAQTDGLGIIGLLSNEGTYALNSVGNITDLRIAGPAGSYVAFGSIFGTTSRLISSNTTANRIYGVNGVEKLVLGPEVIVEGSMSFGINLLEIENFGAIRAVGSSGLVIDPNAAGCTNRGTLAAVAGPLFLSSGTFRNLGSGAVVAEADQSVFLDSSRVEGGLLSTATTGSIFSRSGTLVDTRIDGFVRLPNNNPCFLETAVTFVDSGSSISLESVGNITDLIITTPVTVHGFGFTSGITASNTTANRIYSNGGHRLTLADAAFIRGSMQLGINLMSLTVNSGCAVEAQGSQGLVIDPDAGGVTNDGTLRALNGSTLTLASGTFDNASGVITADPGGVVSLSSAAINGGNFTGSIISTVASTLTGVTNAADLRLPNNNSSLLVSSLINNSTLSMNSVGNVTDLRIVGPVTVSGSGSITSSNTQANRIYSDNGSRLTNANGHTIRGSMQLGLNLMAVTNNGLVEAVGSSGMTIDADAGGFDNNNLVRATSGSSLNIAGTAFENTGATIHAQDASNVQFTSSTITGGTLTSAGSGFHQTVASTLVDVTNTADLRLPNNNTSLLVSTLINNSTFSMDSVGNVTDLRISGPVTVSGSGSISSSNTQANRIYSDNGSRFTNAAGHTIRGSMQFGTNLMSITNNGVVESVGSSGMTIDANADGFDNNSLVRSTPGSSLNIAGTFFDNTAATINAQPGSSVTFTSSHIRGGTISSVGDGSIQTVASTLENVTNGADLRLPNNNSSLLVSSLINNSTLSMNSVGNTTDLRISGPVLLSGPGSIASSNTQANRFYSDNGSRLTNGVGHTIRGSMQLGINLMSITNQGTIESIGSSGMTIDADANGFDNQGTINVVSGNMNIAAAPFTTSGEINVNPGLLLQRSSGDFVQTNGFVYANGELQVDSNDYQLLGGVLGGTGRVDSNVVNVAGTISAGPAPGAPGTLIIEGTYTQQGTGRMEFEVGSTTDPALNDTINVVSGSANLGGTIRIRRLVGFVPPIGQGFSIITTAPNQRFGTFAAIESPDFWHIEYLHNVAVAVFDGVGAPVCPADFNQDGNVDPDDLGDYINCYFAIPPCPLADFNLDGGVDPDDLGDFINAYFGPPC